MNQIRSFISSQEIRYIGKKLTERANNLDFQESNHLTEKRSELFVKLSKLRQYKQQDHINLGKVRWPPILIDEILTEIDYYTKESYNYELMIGINSLN